MVGDSFVPFATYLFISPHTIKRTYTNPHQKGEYQVYDRGLSVLEQYGLESTSVYRGRGSLICETEKGLVLIKEFCGTPKKLEHQARLLSAVSKEKLFLSDSKQNRILVDEILPNKEGAYISVDKDNIPYIVKNWYEGKECDTRCEETVCTGIAAMADLHKSMRMPVQMHYVKEPLYLEFQRHNRELRKIRKFVISKRKKNDFELQFLDSICSFLGHGEEALKRLETSDYEKLRSGNLEQGCICHGEFNQHNVLITDRQTIAVTNFDRWNYDIQMADLYQFMRKILEKHDWDSRLGQKMIQAYQEVKPLTKEEMENLRVRFAYPEKYWKLANYYYTHNKAWISEKNLEKLKKLRNQHEKWQNFVENISI